MLKSIENQIIEFWEYSEGEIDEFDFLKFFKEFKQILESKLALHGVLGFNKYIEHQTKNYDMELLRKFEYIGHIVPLNDDYTKICHRIFYPRYRKFHENYKDNEYYNVLGKVYLDINKVLKDKRLNKRENVLLMDECIHTIHNSGYLINIEKLRRVYERRRNNKEV